MFSTCLKQTSWFWRDESGGVTLETVVILPVLFWCYMATFVLFDAFLTSSRNVKVTYTISDILSREANEPITPDYLDRMQALHSDLVASPGPHLLRASVIRYRGQDDTYQLVWSQTRGGGAQLTTDKLAQMRESLPVMFDGEVGILVEGLTSYAPIFDIGLGTLKFREFTVVRPRFAPTLCWSNANHGPWAPANLVC
jgi:hypothetical protein